MTDIEAIRARLAARRNGRASDEPRLVSATSDIAALLAEIDQREEWINDLAERMPQEYDGDEAQEALIERWVGDLVAQRDAVLALCDEADTAKHPMPGQHWDVPTASIRRALGVTE